MANFPIDSYLQAIAHKRKADAETKGAFGTQLSQGLQTGMAQGFQDVRTNKANALKEISDNNKKLYDNTLTLLQSGKYSIKDSSGTEVDPLEYPKIAKMVSKNEPITGMYKVETKAEKPFMTQDEQKYNLYKEALSKNLPLTTSQTKPDEEMGGEYTVTSPAKMEDILSGKAEIGTKSSNPTGAFTPETLKVLARTYIQSGGTILPNFGLGQSTARVDFWNEVATQMKDSGIDVAEQRVGYQAEQTAAKSAATSAGVQEKKVAQAVMDMAMFNSRFDPVTKEFNIPTSAHTELAMGLARLLSPTGQISENQVNQLRQGTLQDKMGYIVTWFSGDPTLVKATPQELARYFAKTVIDLGGSAEKVRDVYTKRGISFKGQVENTPVYQYIKSLESSPTPQPSEGVKPSTGTSAINTNFIIGDKKVKNGKTYTYQGGGVWETE